MQRVEFEKFCKELIELHRERMYNLEMQFLQDKHGLKRGEFLFRNSYLMELYVTIYQFSVCYMYKIALKFKETSK